MFNIAENVKVEGIENLGITKGHLVSCMHDKNRSEPTQYSYFGKRISRGTKVVNTKVGKVKITFEEENGWARNIKVEAL